MNNLSNDPSEHADESNRIASKEAACVGPMRLSTQEQRVLRCLVEGDANEVIARKIGADEATVKVHFQEILRKIGDQNRTQAAMWAASSSKSCDKRRG